MATHAGGFLKLGFKFCVSAAVLATIGEAAEAETEAVPDIPKVIGDLINVVNETLAGNSSAPYVAPPTPTAPTAAAPPTVVPVATQTAPPPAAVPGVTQTQEPPAATAVAPTPTETEAPSEAKEVVVTAPPATSWKTAPECSLLGVFYVPAQSLRLGAADASGCQLLCSENVYCKFFSFWPNGKCNLYDGAVKLYNATAACAEEELVDCPDSQVISGPKVCPGPNSTFADHVKAATPVSANTTNATAVAAAETAGSGMNFTLLYIIGAVVVIAGIATCIAIRCFSSAKGKNGSSNNKKKVPERKKRGVATAKVQAEEEENLLDGASDQEAPSPPYSPTSVAAAAAVAPGAPGQGLTPRMLSTPYLQPQVLQAPWTAAQPTGTYVWAQPTVVEPAPSMPLGSGMMNHVWYALGGQPVVTTGPMYMPVASQEAYYPA